MILNWTTVGQTLNPSIVTSILNSASFALIASAFSRSRDSSIWALESEGCSRMLISKVGLSDGKLIWSCLSAFSSSLCWTDLLSFSLISVLSHECCDATAGAGVVDEVALIS